MVKLIRKLIFKKLAVRYEFIRFKCANYSANYFQSMFITPKHLELAAGGVLRGNYFDFPLEGYRTPVPNKTTQTTQNKNPSKQGGAGKALYEKR